LLDDEGTALEMRRALATIQSDLNIDTNNRIVDAMLEMTSSE